ncbi:dynein axonemal assembly factor 6 [Bemisia tabaci]|uniref:dynein axonemal assembly factor 6 n=1 Tax=Bemisia tabaci TaxID=7038 RepID=UPI003B281A12
MDAFNIQDLANLLKPPPEDESSSEDDLPPSGLTKLGPGSIGTKVSISTSNQEHNHSQRELLKESDCIWREDELALQKVPYDPHEDPREKPAYDIIYQQSVTPEDIFLQIGPKTPASASCEAMVLKIDMPGELSSEICCDVKKQHMDVRSPRYRLALPLPHPVHHKICKAQWNESTSQLIVTLYLDREYDFINF